jgi:hypothetical protein
LKNCCNFGFLLSPAGRELRQNVFLGGSEKFDFNRRLGTDQMALPVIAI